MHAQLDIPGFPIRRYVSAVEGGLSLADGGSHSLSRVDDWLDPTKSYIIAVESASVSVSDCRRCCVAGDAGADGADRDAIPRVVAIRA